MTRLLRYRAGPAAAAVLRRQGLDGQTLGAFVGPASGPKWLVLAGLDRALLDLGWLSGESSRRGLLVGSSAGGWRVLALASPDPRTTLQGLTEGYVRQVFQRGVTPQTISRAYREMLEQLFTEREIEHVLDHPRFDVALHVVRCRRSGNPGRRAMAARLVAAAGAGLFSRRGPELFFERTVLHTRPETIEGRWRAKILPLERQSFHAAAMATGTVPIYMEPVRLGPALAEPGPYLDGGLTDYHLRQRYLEDDDRIVLFPHYRERIAPGWFDKHLPYRRPRRSVLDNVLQIFPTRAFLERLPDGRLPDRQDFDTFVDAPEERIRRWQQAVDLSEELGKAFREDVEKGRLPDLVEPF